MSSSFHLSGGPFFGAWLPSVSSPFGVVLGFFSKGLKGEGEGRVQEFEVEYFWQQKKEWNKLFRKESKEKNRKTSFENKLFWKTYKNLGSFKLKSFSSQQGGTVVSGANCHRHQPTCIRASRVSKAPISIGLGGGFGWFFGTKNRWLMTWHVPTNKNPEKWEDYWMSHGMMEWLQRVPCNCLMTSSL